MKIGPTVDPTSRICGSNPDTVVVRGFDLAGDLIGRVSFTEHFWLLLTGAMPTASQRAVLDATLVAIAEHGLVPSVVASRMTLAAAPEALQGAVAAGVLGCGSVILGSAQEAGNFLHRVVEAGAESVEAAARQIIGELRASKRSIPGFGHPQHKAGDPRAVRLFEVAAEVGLAGPHIAAVATIERLLPDLIGRPLKMNISAAIPAALLDAGYPLKALRGVPLLARTASLIAHLLEEQEHSIGFAMSHAAASAISYAGPAPADFVEVA